MACRIAIPLLVLLLCVASAGPAFSQREISPTAPRRKIPDTVLYQRLFFDVTQREALADRIDALGRDSLRVRSALRTRIGLSASQGKVLTSVAQDSLAANRAYSERREHLLKGLKGGPIDPVASAQLKAMSVEHEASITASIDQLKSGLGPEGFQALDAYVRSQIARRTTGSGDVSRISSIPETALYQGLFLFTVENEKFADRIDALGKDSSDVRHKIAKQAGLTAAEEKLLKSIAKDFAAKLYAYFAQRTQLINALRLDPHNSGVRTQLAAFRPQLDSIKRDCINQMKSGMGPGRFQVLDAYVRSEIAPHVGHAELIRK